jgi:hypothetical protein
MADHAMSSLFLYKKLAGKNLVQTKILSIKQPVRITSSNTIVCSIYLAST